MHLRIDDETGAIFAADTITAHEAVVSMISTPRPGAEARGESAARFFREWLEQLPASVTRVSAWASDVGASAFMRTIGFADQDGYVTPDGGRAMAIVRG